MPKHECSVVTIGHDTAEKEPRTQILCSLKNAAKRIFTCKKNCFDAAENEPAKNVQNSGKSRTEVLDFDTSPAACVEAGGFRHGEVVVDRDGSRAVAVGVRNGSGMPPTPTSFFLLLSFLRALA